MLSILTMIMNLILSRFINHDAKSAVGNGIRTHDSGNIYRFYNNSQAAGNPAPWLLLTGTLSISHLPSRSVLCEVLRL